MPENAPSTSGDRFGELATTLGVLTDAQLAAALARQAELKAQGTAKRIGEILVEQHVLDHRKVQKVLLEQQRRRAASAQAAPVSGRKMGKYELLAKLGEGGMGAVYKARDPLLDRVVALKILNPGIATDLEFLERFKREARASGSLNHPNIVGAFGAGEIEGHPFLAMEFVDGESLRDRLKRLGRLPEREALSLLKSVAAGLGYAHAQGIIHRDVKPDNVLLGRDGSVKLTDLGLAKSIEDDQRLTKTGIALGTPHYISPEQARGERNVDRRSDIYSLGATLYVLLTGQVPFDGRNNAEIMLKHLKEELENPQDVVPELSDGAAAIVAKMMGKKPAERYDSCELLVEDVDRVLAGQPPGHALAAVGESSIRPPRRRRAHAARGRASGGGCLGVLALAAGLGVLAVRLLG